MPYKITNITDKLITSDIQYKTSVKFNINNTEYILNVNDFIFIDAPILTPKINIMLLNGLISIESILKSEFQTIVNLHKNDEIVNEELFILDTPITENFDDVINDNTEVKEESKQKNKNKRHT